MRRAYPAGLTLASALLLAGCPNRGTGPIEPRVDVYPRMVSAFTTGVVMNGVEIESLGCEFITPHTGSVLYDGEEYIVNFQPIR